MKKAGVVILFNPNLEEVLKNIKSYLEYLDKLYVIDNSNVSHEDYFINFDKIEYVANFKNNGIAAVLNFVANRAIIGGFDLLLTMDQDSFFSEVMIKKYCSFVDSLDLSKTSMVGIQPKAYNNFQLFENNLEPTLIKTKLLITSGSFLNLKLFNKIGGFDKRLFIDWVDYDYCLKSILAGYSVNLAFNIYLFHVGGVPRKILGRNIALYSPERYYYIFRNHLYMWFKYIKYFPKLILKNILVTLTLSLLPNIILSKDKVKFFSSLIKAMKDIPKIFKSS